MNRAGYVLVGGRSTRMGRDKAFLPFRGGVLAEFVASAVASAAGGAVLIGDPQRYAPFGYRVIADLYPGEGPLGGILTALADTSEEWNLIVACDMPAISPEFLGGILSAAEESEAQALVPVGPSGTPQPLCAVYHLSSRAGLQKAFDDGQRKVMAALANVRTVRFAMPEMAQFENVNTPEDWSTHAGK